MRDDFPRATATRRRVPAIALGGALALVLGTYAGGVTAASPDPSVSAETEAGASTGEKPLLVAINRGATQQYFIDLQSAFTQEVERLGGTAKTYDAQEDPSLTLSLMNDAVSAGASGIAVSAQSSDLGPALAEIADAAGVAWVATDSTQVDSAGDPSHSSGSTARPWATRSVRKSCDSWMPVAGSRTRPKKVGVLSVEAQTIAVCEQRTDESKRLLTEAGFPADQIYQVPYGGDTSSGQEAAGPVITAHPDVTNWLIFSCNDEGVLGAINALATAGADPANIIGVGIGAYEACKFWASDLPSGFTAALFISGLDVGRAAANVLWEHVVNGAELPATTIAETTMVDSDHVRSDPRSGLAGELQRLALTWIPGRHPDRVAPWATNAPAPQPSAAGEPSASAASAAGEASAAALLRRGQRRQVDRVRERRRHADTRGLLPGVGERQQVHDRTGWRRRRSSPPAARRRSRPAPSPPGTRRPPPVTS